MNSGQFKPGVSGNRNGRPKKGNTMTDIVRELLEQDYQDKKTHKQALAEKILELSLAGDMRAIRLLWSYMDGLPSQTIETNPMDVPNSIYELVQKYGND